MLINKLSVQTGMIFLLGMTIVVGGLAWHQYSSASERLPLVAQTEAVESTQLIAMSLSSDVLYRKAFPLWKQMTRIKQLYSNNSAIVLREFAVLDHQQLVLTHSDPLHYPIMKKMLLSVDGVQWKGREIQVVQSVFHPSDGRVIGSVILTFDASSIEQELAELREEVAASIAFAMLVALLIAIGMSFRVSRPLRKLSQLAARIGDGDVEITTLLNTPDEIRSLAASMQQADQMIAAKKQQLIENEALLKSLIDHSPAVIFIKNLDGRYVLINSRYEELFHISNEDIIGKTDADVFDAGLAAVLREHDEQVMQCGDAMVHEESVPDGRGLRHYYSLKFPLYDAHKKMYAVCGIATDVTDQNESSAQISKLATVVDQADEIIVVTDAKGVIEYVNPAFERSSGYSAEEVLGKTPRIVKSNKHTDQYYAAMWDTILAGKTWHGDFTNQAKNGDCYEVSQSITPIMDEKGVVTGFASVQRDVTHLRKVQDKLQHTDRVESLGVLAGGIAHDFNNLLTAILGNASLAHRKLDITSPAYKHLTAIENASHSAADLCKQMLAYSGKGMFVVKPISLSNLVDKMGKLIDVSLAKNVVLKYHLHEHLPPIDADVAQMQQVVLNLITNASEAIEGKSGVVSITTGVMQADADYLNGYIGAENLEPGRYIFLEVSDTGCGMDAATQKKVFDPFFTTKFAGRGLGMSAMLGIIKGHHGGLRIYSEKGEGTSIKISFPVSHEHTIHMEPEKDASPVFQGSGTVLVVDDEEGVREYAVMLLEELGFDVKTASNGLEGIEQFRLHQNDIILVLMDMTMPKMDGRACFSALRGIQPDVKVILSSGYNEQDATNRFAGKGLAGFVQKPYEPEIMIKKLQEILL